ncbi:MAG: hypothetical protein WBV06_09310 [Acidimicrobiia bacterium]
MEYTLTPSTDSQYIIIKVVGEFTRPEALKIASDAFELGRELGIRCHLNDMTEARNVDRVIDDVYFTRKDVRDIEARDDMACAAVLVDPSDHSHDFYVAFARGNGIDITLFWDRDEAIAHLLKAAKRLATDRSDE